MYIKKNILILNATKGMGFYFCKYFASKQYQILLLDNSLNKLNAYSNYINNSTQSPRALSFFCNFYNSYQLESLIKYIKINFKKIDFILNNNIIYSNFCFINKKESFLNITLKYFFYLINFYKFLYKISYFLNKEVIIYNTITSINKTKENIFIFNFLNRNYKIFNDHYIIKNKKHCNFNNANFFISGKIINRNFSFIEYKLFNAFNHCFNPLLDNKDFFSKKNDYFINF